VVWLCISDRFGHCYRGKHPTTDCLFARGKRGTPIHLRLSIDSNSANAFHLPIQSLCTPPQPLPLLHPHRYRCRTPPYANASVRFPAYIFADFRAYAFVLCRIDVARKGVRAMQAPWHIDLTRNGLCSGTLRHERDLHMQALMTKLRHASVPCPFLVQLHTRLPHHHHSACAIPPKKDAG
jgi:hypothetical protein